MSDATVGLGWLPVEARDDLEARRAKASAEEADRLAALPPRERLLALLDRVAAGPDVPCAKLSPADLRRVVESFPGEAAPDAADLARRFPLLVEEVTA
jgi:antitoxin (DNA-binding transcriptional repressor) of toxin-antitoxin stability system